MEERFYYCDSCGNLLIAAIASGVVPYCCGSEMTLLKPNVTDGNKEKHVPVVSCISCDSLVVKVGSEPHPMTPEHNIRFVCLQTSTGFIIRYLDESDSPEVQFRFNGKPIALYAYCNLHGLWRATIPDKCITTPKQDCSMLF